MEIGDETYYLGKNLRLVRNISIHDVSDPKEACRAGKCIGLFAVFAGERKKTFFVPSGRGKDVIDTFGKITGENLPLLLDKITDVKNNPCLSYTDRVNYWERRTFIEKLFLLPGKQRYINKNRWWASACNLYLFKDIDCKLLRSWDVLSQGSKDKRGADVSQSGCITCGNKRCGLIGRYCQTCYEMMISPVTSDKLAPIPPAERCLFSWMLRLYHRHPK